MNRHRHIGRRGLFAGEYQAPLDLVAARALQCVVLVAGHHHGGVRHRLHQAHLRTTRDTKHRTSPPSYHSRSWGAAAALLSRRRNESNLRLSEACGYLATICPFAGIRRNPRARPRHQDRSGKPEPFQRAARPAWRGRTRLARPHPICRAYVSRPRSCPRSTAGSWWCRSRHGERFR
jgi:hypothetical protein